MSGAKDAAAPGKQRADDRQPTAERHDAAEHQANPPQDGGDRTDHGKSQGRQGIRRWPLIIIGIFLAVVVIAGIGYWLLTRNEISTDDAYTDGNAVAFASKVSGYVVKLNVSDNTFVHTGDILLKLDDRDYKAARDAASANLSIARAQLASAQVALEIAKVRAPANLDQAQAQLQQAQANSAQAERNYKRITSLNPQATTQATIDQATAKMQSSKAAIAAAQAEVKVAQQVQQNIQAAKDTVQEREAQIKQAEARLSQAEINLSYTTLVAPQDGYITRRNVDKGTFVQAGQLLFYIVTNPIWITANFKETQLTNIHPGEPVTIGVDAYPGLHLKGHVGSIQKGSGARFSAFPAENATGNFVKIVRRVPVKIIIDSGLSNHQVLPLGLSVTPTIHLQ